MRRQLIVLSCFILLLSNCQQSHEQQATSTVKPTTTIHESFFDLTQTGDSIFMYTLQNTNGMQVRILNYGGVILSIEVPDKNGTIEDVTLGFQHLEGYEGEHPYFGSAIGRYGNRIAKGTFKLNEQTYTLATNNGPNSLHGGPQGFHRAVWSKKTQQTSDTSAALILSYISKDGEEGFPGNLQTTITYSLNNQNELGLHYEATTDKPTVVNLTNHSYFNLSGPGSGTILNHELMIKADRFTPVDKTLIPTGELRSVEGTPFDFRQPTTIGARIEADNIQLKYGGGYDHNFVLNRNGNDMEKVASLYDPNSGRLMEILTEEPGLQFYSGNFLDGSLTGKNVRYEYRTGLCLETQHFPDSPNQENFPSVVLKPGETYSTHTVYRFSVK